MFSGLLVLAEPLSFLSLKFSRMKESFLGFDGTCCRASSVGGMVLVERGLITGEEFICFAEKRT